MMSGAGIRRVAASRRGRLGTALIVVGGLALAGCSSGPPASKRPFAAYRQCLQQHGVKPRRHGAATSSTEAGAGATTSTTRPDPAAFAAARQACRGLRPAGGLRGGGINSGARAAFRKCMTDHGVTLPTFGHGGPGGTGGTGPGTTGTTPPRGGMLAGLNRNDPAVASALAACRSLLGTASTTTSTRK
jgi:hypothetical protein